MNKEKILQKLGIEGLNAMQERALKAIGETQKDVIVLSPTGSGKTLAYLQLYQNGVPMTASLQWRHISELQTCLMWN